MKSKRRWLGRRVWVVDADGNSHGGTLWWEDDAGVQILEDGTVSLRMLPKSAGGTRWGFVDGAPSAADRRAGGRGLKREPGRRELMGRLMHEWDTAGLLPHALVALLSAVFPKPPPEPVRLYVAAFAWWCRKPPDKLELTRLALLLRRLDLEQPDKNWIAAAIRKADTYDDEVEAVLRA